MVVNAPRHKTILRILNIHIIKNANLYHYAISRLFLSSFPRNLHSSRVFSTNERPRACSRTVNDEDLTHPDGSRIILIRDRVIDGDDKGTNHDNMFRSEIR